MPSSSRHSGLVFDSGSSIGSLRQSLVLSLANRGAFFDTLRVRPGRGMSAAELLAAAADRRINLRHHGEDDSIGISLDETTRLEDLKDLVAVFTPDGEGDTPQPEDWTDQTNLGAYERTTGYMTHPVFNEHRSETELLRYANRLCMKGVGLDTNIATDTGTDRKELCIKRCP